MKHEITSVGITLAELPEARQTVWTNGQISKPEENPF